VLDPQKLREDMVLIYKTWDETAAAVARSILEDADIACMVKGGLTNDMTGISRLGTMFSSGAAPVEVFVLQSDVEEALPLLEELRESDARRDA